MGLSIDREKVIKGLNSCSGSDPCVNSCPYYDNCGNNYSCTSNLAKDALALLKEQEHEKVLQDRQCEIAPGVYLRKGFCPGCNQEVIWYTNICFCGFCGKGLKWDD